MVSSVTSKTPCSCGSRISQTERRTPGFGNVTSQSHVRACTKLGSLGFQRTALQLQTGRGSACLCPSLDPPLPWSLLLSLDGPSSLSLLLAGSSLPTYQTDLGIEMRTELLNCLGSAVSPNPNNPFLLYILRRMGSYTTAS